MRKKKKNITYIMFIYWILVILWQTVRPVANRSVIDTLMKIALFSVVAFYGLRHKNGKNTGNIIVVLTLFIMTQVATIMLDTLTMGTVITCVFMFAQILIFLIWMRNETVSYDDIIFFGRSIIRSAMIMALYSVIFETGRFMRLFGGGGAYGNECKSFLYSNHEYALYLMTAIIFAVWFYFLKENRFSKTIFLVGFLGINLLSTYSRTAIIGGICAIAILAFFAGIKEFMLIIGIYGTIFTAALVNPTLNRFVFSKILKDSYAKSGGLVDTGRSSMYIGEWDYFKHGTFAQMLFGHGYVGNRAGGHNAYLSILNTGGIAMFIFFVMVILWGIKNSLDCLKRNRRIGSLLLGLQVFTLLYMFAQTPILFYSTMDSYFITVLFVMLPLYMNNYMRKRQLEEQ